MCLLGCLSGLCFGLSLIYSPFVMYFCRKKSTRLTGVIGGIISLLLEDSFPKIFLTKICFFFYTGLVLSLGLLFTSFADEFYQLFFSYGAVICKYIFFLILWKNKCCRYFHIFQPQKNIYYHNFNVEIYNFNWILMYKQMFKIMSFSIRHLYDT